MKRCVVVHSGSRDSYQVALALMEKGYLSALVTDDYRLRKNRPEVLAPKVVTSWTALFLALAHRFLKHGYINKLKDDALSAKALSVANRKKAEVVLAYSYYSSAVFQSHKGRKVLFQLHPHPKSVRRILLDEIALNPKGRVSLEQEHELLLSENEFGKLSTEAFAADTVITASSFTKHTLVENGISESRIRVVPYGVDLSSFRSSADGKHGSEFHILFVGSWNQRKGLSYLVSAVAKLREEYPVVLHVCGRGITDRSLVTDILSGGVEFHSNISHSELTALYRACDVFVFPSLCEGFGHVILEAMSSGLPVITTKNTAGADTIEHGKEGFLVPIRDVDLLVEYLELLCKDRQLCREIGMNARIKAEQFTYEKFRERIIAVIDEE
jgi:glycosyltransferase involved in cell wall biosynthesis